MVAPVMVLVIITLMIAAHLLCLCLVFGVRRIACRYTIMEHALYAQSTGGGLQVPPPLTDEPTIICVLYGRLTGVGVASRRLLSDHNTHNWLCERSTPHDQQLVWGSIA